MALNELIQQKIIDYSTSEDPEKTEGGTFSIGNYVELNF